MKIKVLSTIILSATLLVNTGCNKWLDVTPQAQVNADKLFSTSQGFESALYGVYTSMTRSSMYGQHMTYGLMDILAQYYTVNSNPAHNLYEASRYNYDNGNVKDIVNLMWLDSYNSIANCNILLEYLAGKDSDFFPTKHYDIIKAEALALRAYLHFDLLRAFAPSWKDNRTGLSVPYADSFSKKIHQQITTEDLVNRILADLETSRKLLKDIDPVFYDNFKDPMYHFGQPLYDEPDFIAFRAYRMNYFAVTGLMARIYNYMGDEKAYGYAKEVIDAGKDGRFPFATESEVSAPEKSKDVVMQNEILFALNFVDVHKLFYQSDANSYSGYDLNTISSLYDAPNDLRKNLLTKNSRNKDISYKFADIKSEYGGKVPMLRLSEMYLIAAERGYAKHKEEAIGYLTELRKMRGVPSDLAGISYENLMSELTIEARREFIGEGQVFYWYKRLNRPVMQGAGSVTLTKRDFSLPMPSTEIEFGGRVEEYLK